MRGEGRYIPPEEREASTQIPVELTSKEDLTEFWLTFRRNNPFQHLPEDQERRYAEKQAQATFEKLHGENEGREFYFGMTDEGVLVATGKLQIRGIRGENHGYLSMLAVDEAYRGKRLAQKLTDVRTERAKLEGCTKIDTDVFTGNPQALVTKFYDGYSLTDLEFYDAEQQAGQFILSKKIDGETDHDKKEGPIGELREVQLSELTEIKNLLDQGFLGIDIKNTGDVKDKNTDNWTLILEKSQNSAMADV